MNNTQPEGIVDKNGKHTTVHKRVDAPVENGRQLPSANSSGKRTAGYDEVRDVVQDLFNTEHSKSPTAGFKPRVVNIDNIMVGLIGSDPTRGQNTDPRFGGRNKNAWYGDHISVSSVTKMLDQLVEDGELVKVKEPNYDEQRNGKADKNAPFVLFPYRTKSGYIPTEALDDAKRADSEQKNEKKLTELRTQANATIALRHQEEVEKEFEMLRAEAGI